MRSFLRAAEARAADAASLPADAPYRRPLPTDDAIALLELFGPIVELGAGAGVWAALLRERGLAACVCYDADPPPHTFTHVERGGHEMASRHAEDHTLLLVRGAANCDEAQALQAFVDAGGTKVAYVGSPSVDSPFAVALHHAFVREVCVVLPGGADELTCWSLRPQPSSSGDGASNATTCGILDVRLELVDLEAPEWAAASAAPGNASSAGVDAPFMPEIGGRTLPGIP